MKHLYDIDTLLILARECLLLGEQERPELQWLKKRYQDFQKQYDLKKKSDSDQLLFARMYDRSPERPSEYLKIRYWRTGRYAPINRKQCLLFGHGLELSAEDMEYLIQNYYDHSITFYENSNDFTKHDYLAKLDFIQKLTQQYIENIPKERLEYLKVPLDRRHSYLRHLYFADAFQYVNTPIDINPDILIQHITSIRYDSEFKRHMKLRGEISRKTFIRYLLIFNMPTLTLEKINRQLTLLGYLPLCESHTLVSGEHLDYLLIRLLQMYEDVYQNFGQPHAVSWFQKACSTLDSFFQEEGKTQMRFMYFKALDFSEN